MLIENFPELSKMAPSSYTGLPFKMRCMPTLDNPVALNALSPPLSPACCFSEASSSSLRRACRIMTSLRGTALTPPMQLSKAAREACNFEDQASKVAPKQREGLTTLVAMLSKAAARSMP